VSWQKAAAESVHFTASRRKLPPAASAQLRYSFKVSHKHREYDMRHGQPQALQALLGIEHPIIQAPMAGVSTPKLAAEVCNAGALGSLAVGAVNAEQARTLIAEVRVGTGKPFAVNVFCHRPAQSDPARETAWLDYLKPHFAAFGAEPPSALREIYRSFADDPAMLDVLLETRPAAVSFHFGLPAPQTIAALKNAGIVLLASATSPDEARQVEAAGIDILVAQGYEAGGHRGVFDSSGADPAIGTLALVRLLAQTVRMPIVAAGGIMDGQGIAAAMQLGASGAQLGTAFILCPESSATAHHRRLIKEGNAHLTEVTDAISGRGARGLPNRFFRDIGGAGRPPLPDYPTAYDAAKALHAAASKAGNIDYSLKWAGQAFALARELPAAELVRQLAAELSDAL
jgi:nitronate monooxygenase